MQRRPTKFFISYVDQDVEWAKWIGWALEANHDLTIFQKVDLSAGKVIMPIDRPSNEAEKTFVVWSSEYKRTGRLEKMPGASGDSGPMADHLIVLRIDNSNLPELLRACRKTDLFGISEEEANQRLTDCVKKYVRPTNRPLFQGGVAEQTIQVIGWKGIEDEKLYAERSNNRYRVAFLTTQMSLETLPTLQYFPHDRDRHRGRTRDRDRDEEDRWKFNVVYADYEFVERYHEQKLVKEFYRHDDFIDRLISNEGHLAPAIRDLLDFNPGTNERARCAPVQFGFNEILLDKKEVLGKDLNDKREAPEPAWSYSDFDLRNLLSDGTTKVAIWHWYLPSLLHFLLSHKNYPKAIDEDVDAVRKRLVDDGEWSVAVLKNYVDDVIKLLKDKRTKERLRVCKDMKKIQSVLSPGKEFRAGVVLGSGSSALCSNQTNFEHIEAIVPTSQGVFAWINCAAVIGPNQPNQYTEPATDLIDYWLKPETQRSMFNTAAGYYGLPANKTALQCILNDPRESKVHAVRTFTSLCGSNAMSPFRRIGNSREAHRMVSTHVVRLNFGNDGYIYGRSSYATCRLHERNASSAA